MPSHQNDFNAAVDLSLKYADALNCKRYDEELEEVNT
jgi:hypothetical protein